MNFDKKLIALSKEADAELASVFSRIDEISTNNTERVLRAFSEHRVSDSLFKFTSGYGYDDRGRDTLDEIWADVFGCEDAMVRHNIVNGTSAISKGLF